MKTQIEIDDHLIEQAMATTGAASAEAVVDLALRRLVTETPRKSLLELAGRIDFREDYDHKALRDLRRDVG